MGEVRELWDGYKVAQKARRSERLPVRVSEIKSLSKMGFKVEQKTAYQFRINDEIDLYPIHNRYHNLVTHKRGGVRNLKRYILEKYDVRD